MSDSGLGGGGTGGEGGNGSSCRNRKRILDPLELHEDENNARRPGIFLDWQEQLKSISVPNKKGNQSLYTNAEIKHWEAEDIDQGLADDFDDSLSGLGVDISTVSYNMSEALMALPSVSQFKQEALSPNQERHNVSSSNASNNMASFDESSQSNTTDRLFKLLSSDKFTDSITSEAPPTIHQLLQQHLTAASGSSQQQHVSLSHASSCPPSMLSLISDQTLESGTSGVSHLYDDNRFHYILGSATSIATKVNEETLTYLNQGQSYEIKVKRLGDLTRCKGKLYHSMIRVCFHERRLQYMEREQIQTWKRMRPGERILEVDIPLSYGLIDVVQDSRQLNAVEFDWDPTKEVGVYIRVNCISTEFTPKKHGGEKGVPFRIQVETYTSMDSGLERLHVCACQIKVFKLKGADRKHKQDREKILKRPVSEQEKFQPSMECTILTELPNEAVYVPLAESFSPTSSLTGNNNGGSQSHSPLLDDKSPLGSMTSLSKCVENNLAIMPDTERVTPPSSASPKLGLALSTDANAAQTLTWLLANRFNRYTSTFTNFTGTDLLRLSRSDFIEICGLADGIRLFNSLNSKNLVPRLTLYICLEHEQCYNAVYLDNLTCTEFTRKVAQLMRLNADRIHDVYLQGPSGIHILVTDEVVQNFREESMISIEVLQDTAGERFRLLLRFSTKGQQSL